MRVLLKNLLLIFVSGSIICLVAFGILCFMFRSQGSVDYESVKQHQKACHHGNKSSCNFLGFFYDFHIFGSPFDHYQAFHYYQHYCDLDQDNTCNDLYNLNYNGDKSRIGPFKGYESIRQTCDGGNMSKCVTLGLMYSYGNVINQNLAKAAELFKKACDGGYMGGCFNSGLLFENGRGVPQDFSKARELYRIACGGGNRGGCLNLSFMYVVGKGVPKDAAVSKEFYNKSSVQPVSATLY